MNLLLRSTHSRVSVPTHESNGLLTSYEKALNAGHLAHQYDLLRRIEAESLDSAAVTAAEDQLMRDVPDIPVDLQSLVARAKRHNRSSQYVTRFVEWIRRNRRMFEFAAVTYPYIAALILSALLYAILEGTFTVEVRRQLGFGWLVIASSLLILCSTRASRILSLTTRGNRRRQSGSYSSEQRGWRRSTVLISVTCAATVVLSPVLYFVFHSVAQPPVLVKVRGEFSERNGEAFELAIPTTKVSRFILEMRTARSKPTRPMTIEILKDGKILCANTWSDRKTSCAFTFTQASNGKVIVKLREPLGEQERVVYSAAIYRARDRPLRSIVEWFNETSDRDPL